MKKAAIIMAEGFEESETITIVDVLRRSGIECITYCLHSNRDVLGMQKMIVRADRIWDSSIKEADILIIPGGRPGLENLQSDDRVLEMVRYFNQNHRLLAAMCSGTIILAQAGVIEQKKVTGYTGYETRLTGGIFQTDVVVYDQNIITSQGPATAYPFAFKIAEVLGQDVCELKERLLYYFANGQ